jgi:hypothetical protein
MYKKMMKVLGVVALVGSAGCLPTYDQAPPNNSVQDNSGPGRAPATSTEAAPVRPLSPEDQTAIWQLGGDPALLADRAYDEGPVEVASRKHSCMKIKYETQANMLMGRGVAILNGSSPATMPVSFSTSCPAAVGNVTIRTQSAAFVYCNDRLTLGLTNYTGRIAESTSLNTAAATKIMDLYASAASEIIPTPSSGLMRLSAPNCQIAGQGAIMFNADNTCNEEGIACLQGYPATADQVALCSRIVSQAAATPANATAGTPAIDAVTAGRRLAVATIMAGSNVCE